MGLGAKLLLRQSQSLVMTPQLMQSIRLLQLTHLELDRFIDEEIERNPLLDRAPDSEAIVLPSVEAAPSEVDWLGGATGQTSADMADRLDTSMENVFPDDPGSSERLQPDLLSQWRSASRDGATGGLDGFNLDDLPGEPIDLRAHVAEQVAFAFADPRDRIVAGELADMLDEAGYLRGDLGIAAEKLGLRRADVERILGVCQGFDPAGLFARDLAECLALQLKRRDRFDPAMATLVANLDLLARRDFQALKRLCAVDEEDILDMAAEIRALDPKPGTAFSVSPATPIVPDVLVRRASDGHYLVEVNPATLPRVLVDQAYFARVSKRAADAREKDFLTGCLQTANWLTRSLDQRAKTIIKVSAEIVRQQDGFLESGVRHLRPLNLKTVADAIGLHESTVSRVTANKYMLTPRGIFELRFFFTTSIASAGGGEAHSAEAVRDRIRGMIETESRDGVLSDDAIVDSLRMNGIDIARRTVAKYREGMNIPSSVQRRREKRALASAGR